MTKVLNMPSRAKPCGIRSVQKRRTILEFHSSASLDKYCRITYDNREVWNIRPHYRTCPYHSSAPNRYAWQYDGIGGNPGMVTYADRLLRGSPMTVHHVMRSRQENHAVTNHGMVTYLDLSMQNNFTPTNRRTVTNHQIVEVTRKFRYADSRQSSDFPATSQD